MEGRSPNARRSIWRNFLKLRDCGRTSTPSCVGAAERCGRLRGRRPTEPSLNVWRNREPCKPIFTANASLPVTTLVGRYFRQSLRSLFLHTAGRRRCRSSLLGAIFVLAALVVKITTQQFLYIVSSLGRYSNFGQKESCYITLLQLRQQF